MADSSASSHSRSTWWTAYFLLMLVVWLLGLFVGDHSPEGLAMSVFYGIGLVGLWGYLDSLCIGWRPFWMAYFILTMAGLGYSLTSLAVDPNMRTWPEMWGLVAIAALATAPLWVALWRYAYRSATVWSQADAQ